MCKTNTKLRKILEYKKGCLAMKSLIELSYIKGLISILLLFLLSSCTETMDKLKRVGRSPELAQVALPTADEEADDIDQVKLEQQRSYMRKTNSLWQPGSITFFRDNRAWRIGDIVKVVVLIKDSAKLNNTTNQSRDGSDTMGIPSLFGKERALAHTISRNADPASLLSTNTTRSHKGSGNIARQENISTEIAALVTRVLPNGNLVIQGHQEIRVNYELREIKVAGIIRPKDISSTNSINSDQVAEARISYGGRGVVSDVQQPRVGSQIIDAISPF
ncbi:flagellar basal body L-ring protein FlgH [Candidatus Trichorickettsia mobilis]|uniref:flagellar basal body L-ring protein FlgH n=1 Tax=Candidatus Trichorickettsia mobilis TaxID=1346319 RepID=UPI0029314CFF|nr:flagellar basal body L-ring protein FlgH [Candidatus Trichorickettsia mobilis]